MDGSMIGVVLSCGEEVLFRGGVLEQEDHLLLIREDGTLEDLGITVTTNNGVTIDENGEVVDPMEPSASTILELMAGPQLTHKGNWIGWCCGVAICLLAVASILFADELFRFNLYFPDPQCGRCRAVRLGDRAAVHLLDRPAHWRTCALHFGAAVAEGAFLLFH